MNVGQLELCDKYPNAIPSVQEGGKSAIRECQRQFKYERWNCSTSSNGSHSIFGPKWKEGTKENGFVLAISSASLVHMLTKSCSAGNLSACSCDTSRDGEVGYDGSFSWSGCSDNVGFAERFSKKFVDWSNKDVVNKLQNEYQGKQNGTFKKKLKKLIARKMANLHNNEVGREVSKFKKNFFF